MPSPKFSVVIPAYNQAVFLPEAVKSVLEQTEQDFELIIVNDASPDNTAEVVKQFLDPRIKILTHSRNKGLPAARNTGIRAATGEFIALLDCDDYFHVDKLAAHAAFYDENPDIDIAYNSRYNLHHSSNEIRTIYRPPAQVELRDLIMGFPFSPSDTVFRKSCIQDVGMFSNGYKCGGEDFDYPIRMALAGKQFARIDKALNFRRYHTNRKSQKLLCRIGNYSHALDQAFSHTNFPLELFTEHRFALANRYLEVACLALYQGEYSFGNDALQEVAILAPEYMQGNPTKVAQELLSLCTWDFKQDHARTLKNISDNLMPQFSFSKNLLQTIIAKGFFQKAILAIIWDYSGGAEVYRKKTLEMKSYLDISYLDTVIAQLVIYTQELGEQASDLSINKIKPFIKQIFGFYGMRYFCGYAEFNQVVSLYDQKEYSRVPIHVWRAIRSKPLFIQNRGLWAIALRSLLRLS